MLSKIIKHFQQGTLFKMTVRVATRALKRRSNIFKKSIKWINRFYLEWKGKNGQEVINDPYEIIDIPIECINYILPSWNLRFSEYFETRLVGIISNGNWDIHKKERFIDSSVFIDFKRRFMEGKDWEDTFYYKRFSERLKITGRGLRKCKTWEEFKAKKLTEWDELYQRIKEHGYERQTEPEREVEVGVSRTGEILFIDGRHRLAIAFLLKIKEIPVVVNIWHKEYIETVTAKTNNPKITPGKAIEVILSEPTNNCKEHFAMLQRSSKD
jgi:hypothetical protein